MKSSNCASKDIYCCLVLEPNVNAVLVCVGRPIFFCIFKILCLSSGSLILCQVIHCSHPRTLAEVAFNITVRAHVHVALDSHPPRGRLQSGLSAPRQSQAGCRYLRHADRSRGGRQTEVREREGKEKTKQYMSALRSTTMAQGEHGSGVLIGVPRSCAHSCCHAEV